MLTKQFEKPFGEYSHLARIFLVLKFIHIVKKVKENKDKQKKRKEKKKKCPRKCPDNCHTGMNTPERCQHIPHIILFCKHLFEVKHNNKTTTKQNLDIVVVFLR